MRVEKLMVKEVRSCTPSSDLNEAARIMWETDCGFVPVVEEGASGRVVGVLTDRDLCMASYTRGGNLKQIRVEDAMAREVLSCRPEDQLEEATATMRAAQVRRLPVVDEARGLIGVISLSDIAREAARQRSRKRPSVRPGEVADLLATICQPHTRPASES
jgi:CBS-domain-containing membrane protein